jgi:hypothetical protein
LATRAGVKEFTIGTLSLPILTEDNDRNGDDSIGTGLSPTTYEEFNLSPLIERYLPLWINQGYTAEHPLAIATKVLNKEPVLVPDVSELYQFDNNKLLADVGLTWEQAWVLPQLLRPEFIPELIILCRIGDIGYSPFQFVTRTEKEEAIIALMGEYSNDPSNVANNPNSELIEESKTTEVKPLKSARKNATPESPTAKEGKGDGKES